LTHEEIAEFIGSTRETVTRTLSEFKTRQLVALHGSTLMISNRAALETIGAGD
jgi:CRP/FNR family transcriptional regulator